MIYNAAKLSFFVCRVRAEQEQSGAEQEHNRESRNE
jgi:hypothetical protein